MAVIGNSPATTGTTVSAQSFNGDNSTVNFTLNRSVNSTVDLEVLVDNVQQSPYDSSYSVSGTTLTFSSAPATGTNNIYVIYRGATIATAQVIPDDGSVTNAKMASGAALANVGTGNITADYLNIGHIGGRRNLIINGAMQVAQRGTSTSSYTSDGYSVCDRWMYRVSSLGTWTISKDTSVVPSGFGSSTKWQCTTADASPAAGDTLTFSQRLEGQDLQQLKKGLASAEQVTLSFWVRSSKTGTYIVELYDADNTRHISKSYTIDSADTWEYKTITYAGDTTGQLANDNGRSLDVNFWLGSGTNFTSGTLATSWASVTNANRAVGQVNLGDSASNNWYITGIQLEVGSVATPFERRSYGEELTACQRYYYEYSSKHVAFGFATQANQWMYVRFTFPTTMRSAPSVTYNQGSVTGSSNSASPSSVTDDSFYWQLKASTGNNDIAAAGTSLTASAEL